MDDANQPRSEEAWSFLGGGAGAEELDPRAIHDFVVHLQSAKIHPILIFGTTYSGKTLMILSLLHYARHSADANMRIRLGAPVFPPSFPYADERFSDAEQFYNMLTIEFARGEHPPQTFKIVPFFIPIDIEVAGKTYKLAFLEGNGEWYERKNDLFQQFKQEIVGILNGFSAPISVIFVAPTHDDRPEGDRHTQNFSYECLAHWVEQYDRHRLVRDRDNLMLLLTKWDSLHSPGRAGSRFSDASAKDVLAEIEPWRFIWQHFANLNGPQRAVTPYSAAWINDNKLFVRDDRMQGVFDRFNRTIWNWLFGNLTAAASDAATGGRETLYADVVVPKPKPASFYQRLMSACLWA